MRRRRLTPSLFLIPAVLFLIIFVIYPFLYTICGSFIKWEAYEAKGVTVENWVEILSDRRIISVDRFLDLKAPPYGALLHNFIWIAIMVPTSVFLGLILAYLLREVRGGSIAKSLIFLGMVVPMVVGGILIRFVFDKEAGVVNAALNLLGLGGYVKTWTAYPDTALYALIAGSIWLWTGFNTVIYSAGLETIPREIIEAARVDGATGFTIFWRIIVPLLKPVTLVAVMMTTLWVLKIFDVVYVATMGGPGGATNVLALDMYIRAFYWVPPDYGGAMVVATLLTLLTLGVAAYIMRVTVRIK